MLWTRGRSRFVRVNGVQGRVQGGLAPHCGQPGVVLCRIHNLVRAQVEAEGGAKVLLGNDALK
eukprot:3782685-Lingulodinium_polyedra.AAC.1